MTNAATGRKHRIPWPTWKCTICQEVKPENAYKWTHNVRQAGCKLCTVIKSQQIARPRPGRPATQRAQKASD